MAIPTSAFATYSIPWFSTTTIGTYAYPYFNLKYLPIQVPYVVSTSTATSTFTGGITAPCFATSTAGGCIVPGSGGGGTNYFTNSGATTSLTTGTALAATTFTATSTNVGYYIGTTTLVATSTSISAKSVMTWYGDSLSNGYNTYPPMNYVPALLNFTVGATYVNAINGQTSAQIEARFLASPQHWVDYTIIWSGTNDPDPFTTAVPNVTAMVSKLPSPQHYVVLSPFLDPTFASTSAQHTDYLAELTSFASTFPNHWINLFTTLKKACNAPGTSTNFPSYGVNNLVPQWYASTTQDQIDCSGDIIPSSLRITDVHLTHTGYLIVAQQVANFINADTGLANANIQAAPADPVTYAKTINSINGNNASTTGFNYFVAGSGIDNYGTFPDSYTQSSGLSASGVDNLGVGPLSLTTLTTGSRNVFGGYAAGRLLTTGSDDICIGYFCGVQMGSGNENTGVGSTVFYQGTVSDNTAFGYGVLAGSGAISQDTGIGVRSLQSTAGTKNSAIGYYAGINDTSGTNNTYLGSLSGGDYNDTNGNYTGTNDTFVGYKAMPGTTTVLNNATCIGANCVISNSNSIVFGSGVTTNGFGTSSPAATIGITGTAGINPLLIASSSGATLLTVLPNGNFGIATSTPSNALEVNGNAYIAGNASTSNITATGTVYINSVGNLTLCANCSQPDKISGGNSSIFYYENGNYVSQLNVNGSNYNEVFNNMVWGWSSSPAQASTLNAPDTGLSRLSANVVALGNGKYGSATGTLTDSIESIGTTSPFAIVSIQGTFGSTTPLLSIATTTSSAFATSTAFQVSSNNTISIATSSTSGIINAGDDPSSAASSTFNLGGDLQIQYKDPVAGISCARMVNLILVAAAGACNY